MRQFLTVHWVAGALFMGVALLAMAPLVIATWAWPLALIYLHSPLYMLHQVEEHTGDRFRSFVNGRVFGGVEALTTDAVLWVNLPASGASISQPSMPAPSPVPAGASRRPI